MAQGSVEKQAHDEREEASSGINARSSSSFHLISYTKIIS
jgi:hypothetical protein